MANETDTGLPAETTAADALAIMAAREFDPGELLALPPRPPRPETAAEALPYAGGPTIEAIRTFDPAANLGDAARRGPATIGDGKPLVARIGGVEVVTIPLEHYAALVSPLALARQGVATGATPDPEGMLLLLLSLHAEGVLSIGQLAQATGLDHLDLGDRIAAYGAAQPQPWQGEMDEDGVIRGTTPDGLNRFAMEPLREHAPIEIVPSPEASSIDLPSGLPEAAEVPLTADELAASYNAAVQRGDTPGGAMDREGEPVDPPGRGVAAYDAEHGNRKRSRR